MKKSILNLVGCLAFFSTIAQPTITGINWGQIKRDRYFEYTQNINPNPVPPGNGVIWDFTNLVALPSDSSSLNSISVSPYDTVYPKANIVFKYDTDPFPVLMYMHYYKDSSEFSFLGQKMIGSKPLIYGIPKKLLKFPMVFNSSFFEEYSILNYNITAYMRVKYDGYGTLKLPGSTHYNVYRTIRKDSADPSHIDLYYEWFDDTRSLLSLEIIDNGPIAFTKFLNNNSIPASGISQPEVAFKALEIYPNPGQGHFNITLPAGVTTGYLEVTNALGQLIITKKIDAENPDLFIEDKGVYIVTVYSGKEKYSRKVVVN